jgi:hypothetical protein
MRVDAEKLNKKEEASVCIYVSENPRRRRVGICAECERRLVGSLYARLENRRFH